MMRILIVRLGAIGDVVHALPALAALRQSLPDAHLAWAVEKGGAARLLKDNPSLDELIELDLPAWRKSLTNIETLTAIRRAISGLRAPRFDLALDFQGLLKSALIPWLARVPRRIGFTQKALREPAASIFYTEMAEADDEDHVIKKNLRLLTHIGCKSAPATDAYDFPIKIDSADENFAEQQLELMGGSFAIVNPGGGWPTNLWDPTFFAVIADRLWDAYGIRSVVTYGPGEEELAAKIVNQSHTGQTAMIESTLKQFFALARRAQLFIGGDTGPMHIAAAMRTPIVTIFGPTSSRRNGPFAADDVVVERFDLDCRADCYRRRCSHTSCMKIPVDTVWHGVVKRLQTVSSSHLKVPGCQ